MFKFKKVMFLFVGIISLVLGLVGIALPVLPTTPFLLLSSYCFCKSSDRLYFWFKGTKLYKKHVEDFSKNRCMPLKSKICILAFASSMLMLTFIFSKSIHLRIFIVVLMITKYYYFIFKIKTKERLPYYDR
ncbi:YbaN family protein [Hathewaya histolytica]|uniref:Putative membrane protein STY0526 n=1 Tax=Hathewaya histolytica TaxID=1498 RepID=A0A4U9QZU2_HATHI|nr:YbaN family protein [Hathewaya histolytica]VTQ84382.1 putative membrane protein STY0526 [Hathewaya histolytica]